MIMFSNHKNESSSQKKLNMTQMLMEKKIISKDKILINNNCDNLLDKFNSSYSLRSNNYRKVPYVRQINKKNVNIFNRNKNMTRNRNPSAIRENYINRPNTILNLSKNQKNSKLNKKNKQSSVDSNNKKALFNSDLNTEAPLIKIKKKIIDSNSMRINKNNLSNNNQSQNFQKKIYSLKNNIIYNKKGNNNNIGLNSNFICEPFYTKNKEIRKKLDNKLTERQRIKVNLNIKEKTSKIKPNFKTNEIEQKNPHVSNFSQNIYVNTINNKIDIINNINIDSVNNGRNNKISEDNRISKLNKNKIADMINGKIITNSFQKKSRNINHSNDTYTNEFYPDSSDNKTSLYRLNLNTNETTNKVINFYNSMENPEIKITYHKKTTKQLVPKKTYGDFKNKSNNLNTTKRKNEINNNYTKENYTINNSSKNYIFESINNINDNNITIDSYKKNTNLNNLNNKNFNGIVRTKYSNVYLRKKSGREVSGRLKNAVSNISKKINSGNISYKNDKDENYPGSFLKTSKLIIKK